MRGDSRGYRGDDRGFNLTPGIRGVLVPGRENDTCRPKGLAAPVVPFDNLGVHVTFKRLLCAAAVAGVSVSAQAQLLSEGFDNVAGLAGQGWAFVSNGAGAGDGWFQGNPGIFAAAVGAPEAYAAANWVASASSISDWLMTPVLNVSGGGSVSFQLRLLGDGFLDTVQVYGSNSGASTDPANFSLLASYANSTDTGWVSQSLALADFNGRLAFRYVVADTAIDGNYAGLDSVTVVPEPGALGLMALGLAAALAARRRR